jgi:hypothetical protein
MTAFIVWWILKRLRFWRAIEGIGIPPSSILCFCDGVKLSMPA